MFEYITIRVTRAVNYHHKATTRSVASLPLHVVVHRELVWMWAETQRVAFFLFHVDPVGDEVFVEDVAAQQEGATVCRSLMVETIWRGAQLKFISKWLPLLKQCKAFLALFFFLRRQ
jgi:hypothetical protein